MGAILSRSIGLGLLSSLHIQGIIKLLLLHYFIYV